MNAAIADHEFKCLVLRAFMLILKCYISEENRGSIELLCEDMQSWMFSAEYPKLDEFGR